MLGAERSAARRNGSRYAGKMARHHIGVALNDNSLPTQGDLALCLVDGVEHLALLVKLGLRRVQVLGLHGVVVAQAARTETDDVAGDVVDRPHDPAAETIDRAALTLAGEPGLHQLVVGEAAAAQVPDLLVPVVG